MTVEPIPNVKGKNAPGIKRIYLAALSDIATIPSETGWVISDDIVMQSGKSFVLLEVSGQAGSTLMVDEAEAEDTTSWVYSLEGFIGGIGPTQYTALDNLANNPVMAICENKNGLFELAGEEGRGLRFKLHQEGGLNAGSRRGVAFEAVMDFGHMPYFYTGTLPISEGNNVFPYVFPYKLA